jgi:Endoplasmic reticulum-based factor for assembly of V-ATPase
MTTTATTTTTKNATAPLQSYKKKLEGVTVNTAILEIWKDCYARVNVGHSLASAAVHNPQKDAMKILKDGPHPNQDPKYVPLTIVSALHTLVERKDSLDKALEGIALFFTPSPAEQEETNERKKFNQRMKKLRLQHEETKYVRLTNNLQHEVQDDITAKSMSYAASVGLNMIVAPLSFGCFMYFFAGGIFDYFLGEEFSSRTTGGTDIKRVIVGVISGVVMLFIEMTLFVIRTHEVEAAQLKKKKRKKPVQPFGVYSKTGEHQAMPIDPRTAATQQYKKTN